MTVITSFLHRELEEGYHPELNIGFCLSLQYLETYRPPVWARLLVATAVQSTL